MNKCIVDLGQWYICVFSPGIPGVVAVLPDHEDPHRCAGHTLPGRPPACGEGGTCAIQGHQGDAMNGCVPGRIILYNREYFFSAALI